MQTDRQTDKETKATHWNTAVWDVSGNWQALDALPSFVKEVHRKLEIAPTTGREHFQIHVICHRQVRMSQMSSWIKHTSWKAIIGDQYIKNSLAYIRKVETTAPGAQVEVVHGTKYYQIHELLLEVAKHFKPIAADEVDFSKPSEIAAYSNQYEWSRAAKHTVQALGIEWVTKLSVPTLEKSWKIFHEELLNEVGKQRASIIEPAETGGSGEAPPASTHEDLFLSP